jgi:hypothetical protein
MTGAETMITLTPAAEARLDEYLRQVRAAVARVPEVSPAEIEADVREHIEAAFQHAVRPVTPAELEAVLVRLGPPAQWVPGSTSQAPAAGPGWSPLAWLRRVYRAFAAVLWRGSEDWRLPYLAFGVFALGVVAFPLFPLFLVVSYLLARAGVAVAAEKGIDLGARRWLVYPPMVIVSVPLLVLMLFFPAFAAGMTASEHLWDAQQFRQLVVVQPDGTLVPTRPIFVPWKVGAPGATIHKHELYQIGATQTAEGEWVMPASRRAYYEAANRVLAAFPGPPEVAATLAIAFATAGALAAWWVVLGAIGWTVPGLPRAVFAPLFAGFESRHGLRLFSVALIAIVVWVGFARQIATAAGVG